MSKFENAVDEFLRKNPSEAADTAKRSLTILYGLITDLAQQPEHADNWFKIQQLQIWTPLRFFWKTLSCDPSLPIRAAAKGNLTEAGLGFSDDLEVGEMTRMNLAVLMKYIQSADPAMLQKEITSHTGLIEATELWVVAGFSSFAPQLVVHDLGEDEPSL